MPGRPTISMRAWLAAALFVAVCVALLLVSPIGAAMLSPAIALAAAVGLGLFTGERTIRWVRRVARVRRAAARAPQALAPRRVRTLAFPAGGDVAFALAMRPPPRAGHSA